MPKDDIVTVKLPKDDLGQIIDGLCVRRDTWRSTQQYLGSGHIDIEQGIEECSNPEEAQSIADYYDEIIEKIQQQLKEV